MNDKPAKIKIIIPTGTKPNLFLETRVTVDGKLLSVSKCSIEMRSLDESVLILEIPSDCFEIVSE